MRRLSRNKLKTAWAGVDVQVVKTCAKFYPRRCGRIRRDRMHLLENYHERVAAGERVASPCVNDTSIAMDTLTGIANADPVDRARIWIWSRMWTVRHYERVLGAAERMHLALGSGDYQCWSANARNVYPGDYQGAPDWGANAVALGVDRFVEQACEEAKTFFDRYAIAAHDCELHDQLRKRREELRMWKDPVAALADSWWQR